MFLIAEHLYKPLVNYCHGDEITVYGYTAKSINNHIPQFVNFTTYNE